MPRELLERYGQLPSEDFSEVMAYYALKEDDAKRKAMNKELEGVLPDGDRAAFGKASTEE